MNNTISIELGLADIEIIKVDTDKKGNCHIKVRSSKKTGTCYKCGCENG